MGKMKESKAYLDELAYVAAVENITLFGELQTALEKLAEAEALLRECEPNLDEGMETEAWRSLVRRIDAFLNKDLVK